MFKKLLYKSLPYLVAISVGLIIFLIAAGQNGEIKNLLINISAAFLAIPLMYVCFELFVYFSRKKLRKEIFDYIKMQIDREVLSALNQLRKTIYSSGESQPFSNQTVDSILSLTSPEIQKILKSNSYLGFKILKNWEATLINFEELLKNSLVINGLGDDQVISIINLVKSIRKFEDFQKINNPYQSTGEKTNEYKVVNGIEINSKNKAFPDRYMLLRPLKDNKFIVEDFGDISKYNLDNCLVFYKIKDNLTDNYSVVVAEILKNVNTWLNLTGKEFVVDTRIFRPTHIPQLTDC